jgi:hypothetical protein
MGQLIKTHFLQLLNSATAGSELDTTPRQKLPYKSALKGGKKGSADLARIH